MSLSKVKNPLIATLFKLLQTGFDGATASRPPSDLNDSEEVISEVVNAAVDALVAAQIAAVQATWFVDAVNGSDANAGDTAGAPLKTFGEIVRRYGPNPQIRQTTTVTILSTSLLNTDQISLQGLTSSRKDFKFIVRGTMAVSGNQLGNGGVLTGASAINHAVADGAQTVTIAAQDWTLFVGKCVRITGGARSGATAWVAKANVAGGTARMSPFVNIPAGTSIPAFSAIISPQVGDTLQVLNPTVVQNPLRLYDNKATIVFENIEFQDDAAPSGQQLCSAKTAFTAFNYCNLHGTIGLNGTAVNIFNGCRTELVLVVGTAGYLMSCLVTGNGGQGVVGGCNVDFDTIFQGCNWETQAPSTVTPTIGDVAFYDLANAATGAVVADQGGTVHLANLFAGHTIYGTGFTGYTLFVTNGGFIYYTDTASILLAGGTSFASFSGVNKIAGNLPLAIDVHGNGIFSIA